MHIGERVPARPDPTPGWPARPGRRMAALALASMLLGPPGTSQAQRYTRFAVPDSSVVAAVKESGAQFEAIWNELLTSELRATLAGADSAGRLQALERRVAGAEPRALGSRNVADALRLRAGWTRERRRLRVGAAVAESLGAAALRARDFPRADSLYGAALRIYEGLRERRRVAWVWGSLGLGAFTRGDMIQADSLYRQALAARQAIGDLAMVGNALNTLGSIGYNRRRYDDAWRFYQEARAARERTGERAALGTTLNNLANVAMERGQADSADVYYRAALDLTVAMGDSGRAQEVLNNYGRLRMRGRDPASSLPLFERALAIRRQRGDRVLQAEVLVNMGDLLRQQGHFGEAVARLEEAQTLALDAGDVRTLRFSLINLGRSAIGVGDAQAARPPLERALAIGDSLHDAVAQAQALNDLSIAARLAEDRRGAERLALRALEAAVAGGDSSLVNEAAKTLGELASDAADLAGAAQWFGRAAAAGATGASQRAEDILNLGSVAARRGDLDGAERLFQRALEQSESAQSPDLAWPALLGLGDVAERRGDDAGALALNRRAATMIEDLRAQQGSERPSVRLLAKRLFTFEALIHLLTRLQPLHPDSGYAAEAFHWSERARSRAFLDLVAASGGEAARARPITITEARQLLTSGKDALLAYSVGDSSTSLWVVTRRGWKHITLPARRALRARVEVLRRGLADPATADARATHDAARTLYRVLVEPARPMLEGVDHLIVAPDGALALVPFEALLAADAGQGPAPRGAYLVERFAISYTPSVSALATRTGAPPARGPGAGGIVALGDPQFLTVVEGGTDTVRVASGAPVRAPTLSALPHTASEIEVLRSLAGARPVEVLRGREATRDRLLSLADLSDAAIIHIATHGEANEVEPERSGLWMAAAGDGSGPGFLSVVDILRLRLGAGLVTLSACETGLGRLERGEGVVGLTRAFLATGARSVMVSLWKVSDQSTALLMERFYRDLLKDGATGAAALARAKRALLRKPETRSPFHWAPFVLVGKAG
jgi:CHAT domain-containing protein/Tfp pilus assembly protein PilF